jgi:hypothetical protein
MAEADLSHAPEWRYASDKPCRRLGHEVVRICEHVGLKVVECRYYNLHPIKFIHNHVIPKEQKNAFLKLWFDLEEFLNEIDTVSGCIKHLFMGLYIHVSKM